MKVVIPMAGRGTRLRPQTLVTPKPLLKVAGKTIIEWIVEEIQLSVSKPIDEIHFVIGDFGKDVENELIEISKKINCQGFIHYQYEPLGTAHAIYCAKDALIGEVFIAFADTIFKGKIKIDDTIDGIIWTMIVKDPEKYGVVTTDENNIINGFIEKPKDNISNNAIVGLYYFKNAEKLRKEIDIMIENDLKENNEFQITNCLEELKNNGDILKCDVLEEWLDCGNKIELLNTNNRLIEISGVENLLGKNVVIKDNTIIKNSFIDDNVHLINSTIQNSIVFEGCIIKNSSLKNSIVGKNCIINYLKGDVNIGDYTKINED
jgi:glucose-1-phosphate thymidylyltransferase